MLFAEKMAGGADDDDTILKAFDAFEVNGKIEVDNAFGEFVIEDGMIDAVHLKGLMVSKKEEEAAYSASSSFFETIRPFKCTASIIPSSIKNSPNALSTSDALNLSPKVIRECLNMSASILPLTSKASKALRMVSSSSAPPAIFSAKSMTICVKLTGPGASESMPWASPSETDLPTELKAAQCHRRTRDRPCLRP